MEKSQPLEILKGAILLERRGKVFYEHAAKEARSPALRKVFETMSVEEDAHVSFLSAQFTNFEKTGTFQTISLGKPHDFTGDIITEKVRTEVGAATFEAAAISAAMALEERAVRFYSERSESATNDQEKKIYHWLADWEKTHLNLLTGFDRQLMESVWYDNKFWPH